MRTDVPTYYGAVLSGVVRSTALPRLDRERRTQFLSSINRCPSTDGKSASQCRRRCVNSRRFRRGQYRPREFIETARRPKVDVFVCDQYFQGVIARDLVVGCFGCPAALAQHRQVMRRQWQHDLVGIGDTDTIEDAEAATTLTDCQDGNVTNEELLMTSREYLEVERSKPGAKSSKPLFEAVPKQRIAADERVKRSVEPVDSPLKPLRLRRPPAESVDMDLLQEPWLRAQSLPGSLAVLRP